MWRVQPSDGFMLCGTVFSSADTVKMTNDTKEKIKIESVNIFFIGSSF
jgi:hypothetical protein